MKRVGSRVLRGTIVLVTAACLGLAGAGCGSSDEDVAERGLGDYTVLDASRTYLGRAALVMKPAVVRSDPVYERIPEYQDIRREGLGDSQPRYHLLMRKASQRFNEAVAAMARALGHDYVGEAGTVEASRDGVAPPPDRTDEVIARLK
ncbi:MAG: hypothetical protein H6806_03990 [Planctomycetes bacterium]|nr:hypothetical protein [Planctomycetota bacterium]MCB9828915.1 hypothetical protein [Planctomycetota bacterium]